MTIRTAIVTGGSSGLGLEIAHDLKCHGYNVLNWDLHSGVDVTSDESVLREARMAAARNGSIDVVVNCAGVNFIDWLGNTKVADWDKVMNTNAKGIFLMAKHCAPFMVGGTICNIVSNASRVPMTASIAYNASKAAAEIMTRQLARELWHTHKIIVFGVSPNKLKNTAMSEETAERVPQVRGWSPEYAEAYQKNALLTGEETDPVVLAEFVGYLLAEKKRHKYLAGCVLEYGA